MKILISGSGGFIGKNLTAFFLHKDNIVASVTRSDINQKPEYLSEKLNGADVIINLTGAPILKKWTEKYKNIIYQSRINTTRKIAEAINLCHIKPDLFISASAIGIYNSKEIHNEESVSFNNGFLGSLCNDWEEEALKASCKRIIILRIGIVLSAAGGAFPKIFLPFKFGFGGKTGSGLQAISFIHLNDFLSAVLFIIENKNIDGIVNMVAPEPSTNLEFTKSLSRLSNKPAVFTIPTFFLKILYGEGASILLEGQKVMPEKLIKAGFDFRFKNIEDTLRDILK